MNNKKTKLFYLNHMYDYEAEAILLDIVTADETIALILDQTIFYPQSGGQPSDTGIITQNNAEFDVEKVIFNEGTVQHLGKIKKGNFTIGSPVNLVINQKLRTLHSAYHTAGHLIDYALANLGYTLRSARAYHFPQEAYVEYEGTLEQNVREELIVMLQAEVNKLITQSLPVFMHEYTKDEFLQQSKNLPDTSMDWPLRFMVISNYEPIMCGGTHLSNTNEVGKVIIRKIKNASGKLRVSYEI